MATPTIYRKAQEVKMEIDKGATFKAFLNWSIGEVPNNIPKPLTNYTARMQIRSEQSADTILHELTTENGGITIDEPNGKISLFISDTDTTAFDWNDAVYGLEVIDNDNNADVRRLLYGDIECFDETTR